MTDRYETRASTHADDCWSWGPAHYECAVGKIERMRTEIERLRNALGRILENEAPDWKFCRQFGGYVLDDELREEARAALSKENSND